MKPESNFISAIHKLLPQVYHEKQNNPYRSGTADVWYSGARGDLWVEYKFIPKIPRSDSILPDLSERQRVWLRDRAAEGRNVAVILGVGREGGVIFRNGQWAVPHASARLAELVVSRKQLAGWILDQTGASPCLSRKPSIPLQG